MSYAGYNALGCCGRCGPPLGQADAPPQLSFASLLAIVIIIGGGMWIWKSA